MSRRGASGPTVAMTALVLALISLAAVGYVASKTQSSLDASRDKIEEIYRVLSSLNESIATQGDLGELLVQVREINESISRAATIEDLEVLAAKLASITSQLEDLEARINETSQASAESYEELLQMVNKLRDRLETLQDMVLFPVEIVDGSGDTVVIPGKPERIVSLAPSVTEILYYVNATDRLVGVDSDSDWPQWVVNARNNGTLVDVGGFWSPSIEAILSAEPDLVIGVAGAGPHEYVKEILKAYGVPVILLPQASLDDIKASLLLVGKATGNVVEASQAVIQYESGLSRIKLAAPAERPRVALIVWLGPPTWIAGNSTFQSDALYLVGGVNAFENISGWSSVSPEAFLAAKPDIIIAIGIPYEDVISFFQEQLGDDANSIPAIANDMVYCLGEPYNDMINRPSPRITNVLTILQLIIDPSLYGLDRGEVPHTINSQTLPSPPLPPPP